MSKKGGKKVWFKLKIVSLSLCLLVVASAFLIEVPKGISLVKSQTTTLGNEMPQENLIPQVAGAELTPQIEIVGKSLPPPQFSSRAVLAEDFDTGQILYQENIHGRLRPASTTKLMTALVAIDYYKMGDVLEVPPQALVGGSSMGLAAGEKLSFRSLLYGMLLDSGNDAAYTLALNYPGGIDNFMTAMNQRAKSLGLLDTHFQNPAGFDDPGQYSSAYDLAKIAHEAVMDPALAKIISTKNTEVTSEDNQSFYLHNLNELLGEDGVLGIKTGTTEQAGENFIGLVDQNNHEIITVVLGSTNRFPETKSLIDWVYQNFSWKENLQ